MPEAIGERGARNTLASSTYRGVSPRRHDAEFRASLAATLAATARACCAGFQEARMAREGVETTRQDDGYEGEQGEQRGARLLREILEVAILTLLLFIVVHLVVQNYRVDGPSMQTTLHNHEYILVDKAQYAFSKPRRGDVIVFEYPLDTTQDYVKRVIGVPGDTGTASTDAPLPSAAPSPPH